MLAAPSMADAQTTIRVQSVIPISADEVVMLKDFAEDVKMLTNGEVVIEVLPAGAVVGVAETLDAVDKGLIEGGFAWTHYWSGKHPAAMLFGSPPAGSGLGMDNTAWVSWFLYGGGQDLYDRLWEEMGVNVKGFILQPVGPEALGWFKEPITSMDDFRERRFRTPPGMTGQVYNEMGVPAVSMGGGDIVPGPGPRRSRRRRVVLPEAGPGVRLPAPHEALLPAGPAPDRRERRHLLQWRRVERPHRAPAEGDRGCGQCIADQDRRLPHPRERQGAEGTDRRPRCPAQDTPDEYFTEFMAATQKILEQNAAENDFFREVLESQRAFAEVAVPYWSQAQHTNSVLAEEYASQVDWWTKARGGE
jgi:TRAP-type mannitol/chloroaromatic compound transport system substrate-binding protein